MIEFKQTCNLCNKEVYHYLRTSHLRSEHEIILNVNQSNKLVDYFKEIAQQSQSNTKTKPKPIIAKPKAKMKKYKKTKNYHMP